MARVGQYRILFWPLALLFLNLGPSARGCPWFALIGPSSPPWAEKAIEEHQKRLPRSFSPDRYERQKLFWQNELASSDAEVPSFPEIIQKIKDSGDGSPENIMALLDVLSPTSHLGEEVAQLEERGLKVRFRFRRPSERQVREDDLKWRFRVGRAVPPLARRPKYADVWVSNEVPQSPEELASRMVVLSHGLASPALEVLSHRSPLLSLPAGSGRRSYPKQLLEGVKRFDEQVYSAFEAIESHSDVEVSLPKKGKGKWRGGEWLVGAQAVLRYKYWPFYRPTNRHRANQQGFQAFKNQVAEEGNRDLDEYHEERFRRRARVKWFADWALRSWVGTGLIYSGIGIVGLYRFLREGGFQSVVETSESVLGGFTDEDAVNAGLREYADREGGDPVVNAFFAELIAAEQQQIHEKGDPGGERLEKIRELTLEVGRLSRASDSEAGWRGRWTRVVKDVQGRSAEEKRLLDEIHALREEIFERGDPDKKHRNEIQALIEERDFLKN